MTGEPTSLDAPNAPPRLSAPFPWFGGKSRCAAEVWSRFGDVPNYVEPFAGSLAVLLARPSAPRTETVNDKDRYVSNFWCAVKADPLSVAEHADWPVNEVDLRARHTWLVSAGRERLARLDDDPDDFDAKVAGWWVWGLCSWIGTGWCPDREPAKQLPHLGSEGMGIHRKLPHLGDEGRGIHAWFMGLSARLRRVRVACGDWKRVVGDSVTTKHGTTALLLDPPYDDDEHSVEYAAGNGVFREVAAWAAENGNRPDLRVALCGYEGTFSVPPGWSTFGWKTKGGYGAQGNARGRQNQRRERIWFSPACLRSNELFEVA